MKEIKNVVSAFSELKKTGKKGVLASVVNTSGSTYRRSGAKALILPDDRIVGLIGGGCLESDLLKQAQKVRISGNATNISYDNYGDEDIVWGLGLGCAGLVDVLLEPVSLKHPGPIDFIETVLDHDQAGQMMTVIDTGNLGDIVLGARWFNIDGEISCSFNWQQNKKFLALAKELETVKENRILRYKGVIVLLETIQPSPRLVIFGAGADAIPLVSFASGLGWKTEVIDKRPGYATAARFPLADNVQQYSSEEVAKCLTIDADTIVMLMTHNYLLDLELAKLIIDTPARYIGVLGPKSRLELLIKDMRQSGWTVAENDIDRFYGPAGFDIGTDTPEEIALSIIVEVQAFLKGRSGRPLRERSGSIHEQDAA